MIENTKTKKHRPDNFTRISFYINLIILAYFLFWNLTMLVALNTTQIIETFKHLPASQIIDKRGMQLGFATGEFHPTLNRYYVISSLLFLPIFLSLFLLWKKRRFFYPILLFSLLLQLFLMIILLGITYFMNDIRFSDKILWLVLFANSTIYWALLKKESQSDTFNFFNED